MATTKRRAGQNVTPLHPLRVRSPPCPVYTIWHQNLYPFVEASLTSHPPAKFVYRACRALAQSGHITATAVADSGDIILGCVWRMEFVANYLPRIDESIELD